MSHEKRYPLFIPPEPLADRTSREWTRKEARLFFDWYQEVLPHRVADLLDYFDVDRAAFEPRELLVHLGEQVVAALVQDQFSEPDPEYGRRLTNAGYALAADMGLLCAQLLLAQVGDKVRWDIVFRPKRSKDYHYPVLAGIHIYGGVNPVSVSIARACSVLRGQHAGDGWVQLFDRWLERVADMGRARSDSQS